MNIRCEQLGICLSKKRIINQVSLSVENERITMILGENGAGKTTLMKTLMGFYPQYEGKIYYDDMELQTIPIKKRARLVSYIPQSTTGLNRFRVLEFVLMGATPYMNTMKKPTKSMKEAAESALKEFGILHLKDCFMPVLSGGERQLVYLARTVLQNTPMMILDEPMAALDYKRQHEFMKQLKQYVRNKKTGVLLSVHDPNLALQYADTIVIFHNRTIAKIIVRENDQFEQMVVNALRLIYGTKVELLKQGQDALIHWKE